MGLCSLPAHLLIELVAHTKVYRKIEDLITLMKIVQHYNKTLKSRLTT